MKVESYKIKGWKKKEQGLLISENEDWILVKHIPVDYVIDGYKLYSKNFIKKRESKEKELQVKRVLSLKKVKAIEPDNFTFGSTIKMLEWVENEFGLFEFQEEYENELTYGKINEVRKNILKIDMIKANGKIVEKYDWDFDLNKIRSITFMTDYFESIRLMVNEELLK